MEIEQFRHAAMESAEIYYQFLAEHGRGVSEIAVSLVEPSGHFLLLHLRTRLSPAAAEQLDDLEFELHLTRYPGFQVKPVEYDKQNAIVKIKPDDAIYSLFSAAGPDELTLISDLKFLVQRVGTWYRYYGGEIAFPPAPSAPVLPTDYSGGEPSEEQRDAIMGALSAPFSYIWGAPGTGKTRFVLSNCVLSYLERPNGRVLLVAPTNNALEQMLRGLLPILIQRGIPLNKVLRLGTPSSSFAEQYSAVCETSGVDRMVSAAEEELTMLDKCLAYRSFSASFSVAQEALPTLLDSFCANVRDYLSVSEKVAQLRREKTMATARHTVLYHETTTILAEIKRFERLQAAALYSLKCAIFPKKYAALQVANEAALDALRQKSAEYDGLSSFLNEFGPLEAELLHEADGLEEARRELVAQMESLASFYKPLLRSVDALTPTAPETSALEVHSALQSVADLIAEKSALYPSPSRQTDEALDMRRALLSARLAALETSGTSERLRQVSVVAVTCDKYITTFFGEDSADFKPQHIFMDEAGYCSLIKAAPLLSAGVPVTLLGDHMQLPPICEMDDDAFCEEQFRSVFLWSQSAVHLEVIFSHQLYDLYKAYAEDLPAPFQLLQKYDLTATYRFSAVLSNVLAEAVYTPQFHSALQGGTELFVLNAPYAPDVKKRANRNEANAIAAYIEHAQPGDYAILSPYRNQVALLSTLLPSAKREERVLTVHASQGREWDTVFFSVSDTHNHFFTDSQRPATRGKAVVNTAVSRARKRLILVCDYNYWVQQDHQLIGRLVQIAKPFQP